METLPEDPVKDEELGRRIADFYRSMGEEARCRRIRFKEYYLEYSPRDDEGTDPDHTTPILTSDTPWR